MDRLAIELKDDLSREASQFERIARRWGDGAAAGHDDVGIPTPRHN